VFRIDAPVHALDEAQIEQVHEAAMHLLRDVGTEVRHDGLLERLAADGQRVEGTRVRWDPEYVLAQVAKAPRTFTVRGRNPANELQFGTGRPSFVPVGGSPFCSDLERGRRDGTIEAHDELIRLAHSADVLTCMQVGVVEASDLHEDVRHMDMEYSVLRWSDRPYVAYGTAGYKARDGVELAAIARGGRDAILETPAVIGIVNPNSPLVWDGLMAECLVEWADAGQAIGVTPFLLAGTTAPVSVAAGLALNVAESLSGVALAQLVRPGNPCLFGSFYSASDMRTGGPSFGTPEGVFGSIAGGQLARRYGLPYRGGGGLCTSNSVDAQAAFETAMSLWGTMLGGCELVMHAAGWLEGGLTASYEKMALDCELLRMFTILDRGVAVGEAELALDAIAEEGPGGMFLASMHTLEHYKDWLFMSPLFRSQAYPTWQKQGGLRSDQQATLEWKAMLERYVDPGIDDATDAALREYIDRRKREIGADDTA
jgi:trimethylamine--corrinoid protein Co-methyltransferase